jgi:hypothetical protein
LGVGTWGAGGVLGFDYGLDDIYDWRTLLPGCLGHYLLLYFLKMIQQVLWHTHIKLDKAS